MGWIAEAPSGAALIANAQQSGSRQVLCRRKIDLGGNCAEIGFNCPKKLVFHRETVGQGKSQVDPVRGEGKPVSVEIVFRRRRPRNSELAFFYRADMKRERESRG